MSNLTTIQYRCSLDHLLQEIVYVEPVLGPVFVLKSGSRNGFYLIALRLSDSPKPALVFPYSKVYEPIVDIPITLPMGCKNRSHIFYMDMETMAYMDNNDLCTCRCAQPHTMDDRSKRISIPSPPPIEPTLVTTSWNSVLGWKNAESMVYI